MRWSNFAWTAAAVGAMPAVYIALCTGHWTCGVELFCRQARHVAHPGFCGCASGRRTNSQLLTLPNGSGMKGCVSSWRHSPSTMNLYWWYLHPAGCCRVTPGREELSAVHKDYRRPCKYVQSSMAWVASTVQVALRQWALLGGGKLTLAGGAQQLGTL